MGTIVPNTTHASSKRQMKHQEDGCIRWFLVLWTAILTLLVFGAYFRSGDIRVLLGGTIVAIAVGFVYAYYFHTEK